MTEEFPGIDIEEKYGFVSGLRVERECRPEEVKRFLRHYFANVAQAAYNHWAADKRETDIDVQVTIRPLEPKP